MSLFEVERFIFQLKQDPALQAGLHDGDGRLLDDFALSGRESAALRDGAIETLYAMGVHPLLLAPYSRYVGIGAADYHRRLAVLAGSRVFSSARRFATPGE